MSTPARVHGVSDEGQRMLLRLAARAGLVGVGLVALAVVLYVVGAPVGLALLPLVFAVPALGMGVGMARGYRRNERIAELLSSGATSASVEPGSRDAKYLAHYERLQARAPEFKSMIVDLVGDEFEFHPIAADHPDVRTVLDQHPTGYVGASGMTDQEPADASLFVAYLETEPFATGSWRRRTDVDVFGLTDGAEVTSLHVIPDVQGTSAAARMLDHLEATAMAADATAMVAQIRDGRTDAIDVFTSSGYAKLASPGPDASGLVLVGKPL